MEKFQFWGRKGEEMAATYLQRSGYFVLEKNWRLGHLELDLICRKGDMLVVVEVKTRRSMDETPEDLLHFSKRRFLRQAADAYVRMHRLPWEVRFDLIIVKGDSMEIEHIEEAIQIFE
jgi:putative endonuclease